MPRIARIVIPGVPHLISQCGNRSEPLFHSADDRLSYLETLSTFLRIDGDRLWSYRLDDRELLLVVVPARAESLAMAIRKTHGAYGRRVNRRQGRTGSLFAARFRSCPVDEQYLSVAVRYVERFEGAPPPEPRCSAGAHCRGTRGPGNCLDEGLPVSPPDWRAFLTGRDEQEAIERVLSRLRLGKPAGSPSFVERVEDMTGLNLSRRPGRPRKPLPAG